MRNIRVTVTRRGPKPAKMAKEPATMNAVKNAAALAGIARPEAARGELATPDTVTTTVLLDCQLAVAVTSCVVPSDKRAVAVN